MIETENFLNNAWSKSKILNLIFLHFIFRNYVLYVDFKMSQGMSVNKYLWSDIVKGIHTTNSDEYL